MNYRPAPRTSPSTRAPPATNAPCRPPTSIYFVKIYKTGSTTMYNLLARYAANRGLRWATYNTRPHENNVNSTPRAMLARIVPHYIPGVHNKFNIIADHSCYDSYSVNAILEQPVSYITFLRSPVAQARSFIFELSGGTNKTMLPQDPLKLVLETHTNMVKLGQKHKYFGLFSNIAARQLGFSGDIQSPDDPRFKDHFEKIKLQFVVGLTEYYTLSVLLLRRKLCMEWKDLIFIPVRKTPYRKEIPMVRNEELSNDFCKLSPLDCYIYDHFNRSFWEQVNSWGKDLTKELEAFDFTLKRVSKYCSSIHAVIKATRSKGHFKVIWRRKNLMIAKTAWGSAFEVSPKMCAAMRLRERALGSYFYFRQNFERCKGYRRPTCPIYDRNIRHVNCAGVCRRSRTPADLLDALLTEKGAYIWH